MTVAEQNIKTLEFAINDTSSTSSYFIKIEGYNDVFDHTCHGGGIYIVSSQNSKAQILYTDWGVKYRLFKNGAWTDWKQITIA